jgi:hypothetical protein
MATSGARQSVALQGDLAGRGGGPIIAVLVFGGLVIAGLALAASPTMARLEGVSLTSWGAAGAVAALGIALIGSARLGGEGYLASLWVFAPLAPAFCAGVSVVSYLLAAESPAKPGIPAYPADAVAIGLGATLLAWSASAFPGSALASRRRAQMRIYDQLIQRCGVLEARVSAEQSKQATEPAQKALAEANCRLEAVKHELHDTDNAGPAFRWVLSSGYTGIRRELHRVEEALYSVESQSVLVGDVLHDDLCLEDSGVRNQQTLRQVIRDAMRVISPGANHVLLRPVHNLPPGAMTTGGATGEETEAVSGGLTKDEAREALREVRFAINDYRDDIMDRFALGRNKLIWTFLAVALTTYALIGLGLILAIPKTVLVSVSVLYLVASLVGLFNRLRIESTRSSTVEDYGLYLARLVTGALLSGLAGVAGVYLIAQAPAFLGPLTETTGNPVATAAATAPRDLADIYNLTKNQLALLVAAAFGLAPGALTTQLQVQVDRLERDLQRSEPATSSSTRGSQANGSEGGG